MILETELAEFRREVRAWLDANTPQADFLLPQSFMEVGDRRALDFLRAWQAKVYEAGYLGMAWPSEYGGGGRPQAFQDVVTDEMVRRRCPFMFNTIGLNWAGPLMLEFGSHETKARYIPHILSGEHVWCQGFSEPDHGSDLSSAETRAVRDGDGYRVSGSKIWTTLGPFADHMILLARTDPDPAARYGGLSFFLCPMQTSGIEVRPIRKMTGEWGFAQVFFDDAWIPSSCRLGAEGEGWALAVRTLAYERNAAGGQAGGPANTYMAQVSDLRELASRSRIGELPALQDPLFREQMVRLQIDETAFELTAQRQRIPALVEDRPNAIPLSFKLMATDLRMQISRTATTLLGPEAALYVGDPDAIDGGSWLRNYFNLFSITIGGGTTEIQKNIIGERVLGLPKG